MKVIISHSQKQHSYRLALALVKSKVLKKFYTSIFFFSIKKKSLTSIYKKKRYISGLNHEYVSRTFVPEILYQLIKKLDSKYAAYILDRTHDFLVSRKIKQMDCDYVIGYERQCLKTFKAAKKLGKKTILDLASIHPDAQKELNEDYNNITTAFIPSTTVEKNRKVKKLEYSYTDYVIVLSEYAKKTCINNGVDENTIYTVKLGVDTNFFCPKTFYDKNNFNLVFVAGVRYWKGIKELIESFNELGLSNASLTIIGSPGDAIKFVEKQLSENIKYIPHLPQESLKKFYQNASVFILPSYMDSWGQVVCEAMSCGTPVIVTKSTGASDVVVDGESGFVIDTADKEALKEKIQYLYLNRDEIERMGTNARRSVEHLSWDHYYDQINSILLDIDAQ